MTEGVDLIDPDRRRRPSRRAEAQFAKDLWPLIEKLYSTLSPQGEPPKPAVEVDLSKLKLVEIDFDKLSLYSISTSVAGGKYPWEIRGVLIMNCTLQGLDPVTVDKIQHYDLVGMWVFYWPGLKPRKCYIRKDNWMIFEGCDQPVVAFLPEKDKCYIAVYGAYTPPPGELATETSGSAP